MSVRRSLDGTYLQAFLSAHRSFQSVRDLPIQKKRLSNYEIDFSENHDNYQVDFLPKRGGEDMNVLGGETSMGRAIRFIVRKRDFKVIDIRRWR